MMDQVIHMQQAEAEDHSAESEDKTARPCTERVIPPAVAAVEPRFVQAACTGHANGHAPTGGSCRPPTPDVKKADVFCPPRVPQPTPPRPTKGNDAVASPDVSTARPIENQNPTRTIRATGRRPAEDHSTGDPRSRSATPVSSRRLVAADSPRPRAGVLNSATYKAPTAAAHKMAATDQQARHEHQASTSTGGSEKLTAGLSPRVVHRASPRSQATQRPLPTPRKPSPSRIDPHTGGGSAAASPKIRQATPPNSARETTQPLSSREVMPPNSAREARDYRANHDVLRTSTKPPTLIMQELKRAFAAQRIANKQVHALSVKCQCLNLRFDVEVAPLDRLGSVHAVRARRIAGESWQYKAVCNRLLADIRIT